jgi:hypothetical protein
VPRSEMKQHRGKLRDYFFYFYVHYHRLWALEEKISDHTVRKEPARNPLIGEQGYILGAAQSANSLLVFGLLKERLVSGDRRTRLRLISHAGELALRGRFKLTAEGE